MRNNLIGYFEKLIEKEFNKNLEKSQPKKKLKKVTCLAYCYLHFVDFDFFNLFLTRIMPKHWKNKQDTWNVHLGFTFCSV